MKLSPETCFNWPECCCSGECDDDRRRSRGWALAMVIACLAVWAVIFAALWAVLDRQDERHLCPLQLDVIERALVMWSNAGDVVLSPFMGIGSEGVTSLKLGRKFIGTELKESYWRHACRHLDGQSRQADMFRDAADATRAVA